MGEAVIDIGSLPPAQREIMIRVAGHKYAWSYISRRELRSADALERRGLVEYGIDHGRDHWDCPVVKATEPGKEAIARWWPTVIAIPAQAPAVTGAYDGEFHNSASLRGVTTEGVRRVIDWLDSEQDPGAVVSHHGVNTTLGEFKVTIAPVHPPELSRGSVLVFEVREEVRRVDKVSGDVINGISPSQRDELMEIVEGVVPVLGAWNGLSEQCVTCSFCIDKAPGAGVARALANYRPFETEVTVRGISSIERRRGGAPTA